MIIEIVNFMEKAITDNKIYIKVVNRLEGENLHALILWLQLILLFSPHFVNKLTIKHFSHVSLLRINSLQKYSLSSQTLKTPINFKSTVCMVRNES